MRHYSGILLYALLSFQLTLSSELKGIERAVESGKENVITLQQESTGSSNNGIYVEKVSSKPVKEDVKSSSQPRTVKIENDIYCIDKVVARINGVVILMSDVDNAYRMIEYQSKNSETPSQKKNITKDEIFEDLVNQALIISEDTEGLYGNEKSQIKSDVRNTVEQYLKQCGDDEDVFKKQLGCSVSLFEQFMYETRARQRIHQRVVDKILEACDVAYDQVFEYYKKNREDMPHVNAQYEVYRLARQCPDTTRVLRLMEEIKSRADSGENFDTLAKRYSQDSSKKKGGDIGYKKIGEFNSVYESVALDLKNGEVSDIFESDSGYYIIKMEDKRDDAYRTRMIYIHKDDENEEMRELDDLLEETRARLLRKEISWTRAVEEYSQDELTNKSAGRMTGYYSEMLTDDDLNGSLKEIVSKCKVGTVTQPQTCVINGKLYKCLYYFKDKIPAHNLNPDYDYEKVRQMAIEDYKKIFLNEHIANFISKAECELDYDYLPCRKWLERIQNNNYKNIKSL